MDEVKQTELHVGRVEIFLDEIERVHTRYDELSARISRLEDRTRGSVVDPMQTVMLWCAVAYAVSLLWPVLREMFTSTERERIECDRLR